MKILIVEDDRDYQYVLIKTLKSLRYDVVAVSNGTEAYAVYQDDQFQIVILDWLVPGIDGLNLCRLIRSGNKSFYTFIIILTVKTGKEHVLEAMDAGADDFITKPGDHDILAARLRVAERILKLQSENRQLAKLIPICSYCRKVRNDKNYWKELDQFLVEEGDTKLSHGICPDCYEEVVKQEFELKIGVTP